MKKTLCFILLFVCFFALTSCEETETSKYNKEPEAYLTEGEDYIDHSSTYDSGKLSYDKSLWYVNELKDLRFPDPYVYYEDGTYYITGTTDGNIDTIRCYTTTDFVTYNGPFVLYDSKDWNYPNIPDDEDCWERNTDNGKNPYLYAPEMYKFGDKYYLYYSALDESSDVKSEGVRRNSVLVADTPLGPYEHVKEGNIDGYKEYVFKDKNSQYGVLDITMFSDDDGSLYMYYAVGEHRNLGSSNIESQHIVGVKMKSPIEADWSTYTVIVRPGFKKTPGPYDILTQFNSLSWEMYRDSGSIAEAPAMIKSNGKYYMTYSVNGCWNKYYNVCYAVSDSPLGVFEKPYDASSPVEWSNLLIGYPGNKTTTTLSKQWAGFASGTGHHCFFKAGDQWMIGYHAHQNRDFHSDEKVGELNYTKRYFAFDFVHFAEDGTPFVNGPTYSINPLPEDVSGYKNIAPNATVYGENVDNLSAVNDNYMVDCSNLSQEAGKEVVIKNGYAYIELVFDDIYEIAGIAIYNSSYYDKYIPEVQYIDFGNGNALYYAQYSYDKYVNDLTEFVFPCSAISVEFPNRFTSNRVVICFNLADIGQINEIVVLGKSAS